MIRYYWAGKDPSSLAWHGSTSTLLVGSKLGYPNNASPISLILHTAKKGPKFNRSNTQLAVSGEVFFILRRDYHESFTINPFSSFTMHGYSILFPLHRAKSWLDPARAWRLNPPTPYLLALWGASAATIAMGCHGKGRPSHSWHLNIGIKMKRRALHSWQLWRGLIPLPGLRLSPTLKTNSMIFLPELEENVRETSILHLIFGG